MVDLIRCLVVRAALGLGVALAGAASIAAPTQAATDGPYQDVYWVNGCASGPGVFSPTSYSSMSAGPYCPDELETDVPQPPAFQGSYAKWSTITPSPSIRIVGVTDTGVADCNLHHDGFAAGYFWGDNGVNFGGPQVTIDCHGAVNRNGYAGSLNQNIQSSRYLGWSASCNQASCTPTGAGVIVFSVLAITLEAQETSGPGLTADQSSNLYYQSGWVRGAFPADLSASDPSGVCSMQTTVNGRAISSYVDPSPDSTQWTQCHGSEINANVDTTAYPNGAGAITLAYTAANAAGAPSTATKAINVDNVTPTVSLSAPPDTASTAGTQDVTATATAGPSGIAAISCSVDGGPVQTYPGASGAGPGRGHRLAPRRVLGPQQRGQRQRRDRQLADRDARSLDPPADRQRDHLRADRRRAALPHRDRGRQGRGPRAHRPPTRQARPGARTGPDACAGGCASVTPAPWCAPSGWCSSATASRCAVTASSSTSNDACAECSCPTWSTSPRAGSGTARPRRSAGSSNSRTGPCCRAAPSRSWPRPTMAWASSLPWPR